MISATVFKAMNFTSSSEKELKEGYKGLKELPKPKEPFEKAPEDLCKPLLVGRKGKGTRKQRKLLNAKSKALVGRQAIAAMAEYNEYIAQHCN